MSVVIQVDNVSKQYRLGQVGRRALSQDFNRWWHVVRGKEDPYLKIGQENDRTTKGNSEYVWSLRDINFEINQGDVVGIIGRNGAGKSTLLKILSKVTTPTIGDIRIKGRIASLLEVGTGFHPDLSGRDNIFLNGAILGMTRSEIQQKFDEIVSFAGVERYIDTPVKRYSSGMYVRLAFAVAAHLEPDILIVDEVLAVGDAEFQKKCMGKMKDVSVKDGRTVLFVSHNMEAILKLCSTGIFLKNGLLVDKGNTASILSSYLKSESKLDEVLYLNHVARNSSMTLRGSAKYKSVSLLSHDSEPWKLKYKQPLSFALEVDVMRDMAELEIGVAIFTITEFEVVSSLSTDHKVISNVKEGTHQVTFSFCDFYLLLGVYKVSLGIRSENGFEDYLPKICEFEVLISDASAEGKASTRNGIIVPKVGCTLN